MDIETLIGALNADERAELLKQLTATPESPDETTHRPHDGKGCCGGGHHMAHRREMMAEMRLMCCGNG